MKSRRTLPRLPRLLLAVVLTAALVLSLGSPATAGSATGDGASPAPRLERPGQDSLERRSPEPPTRARNVDTKAQTIQQVSVDWSGCEPQPKWKIRNKKKFYKNKFKAWFKPFKRWRKNNPCAKNTSAKEKKVVIPTIGDLTLTCKPNKTLLTLFTAYRARETQMWLQKYEQKGGRDVVAVKVPRVYQYANWYDDGTGGTGFKASEGLNQVFPIENYSKGYINGIISARPGRHQAAAYAQLQPVTTFELTWYWNGFRQPKKYRSCKIDATFTTRYNNTIGLNWHSEEAGDDGTNDRQTSRLPGQGYLDLVCETGVPGSGIPGQQTFAFRPDDPENSSVYFEVVDGEGPVEDRVQPFSTVIDDATDTFGPYELPRNGTVRALIDNGGNQQWLLLSSVSKINDPDPNRNLCEIAGGRYNP